MCICGGLKDGCELSAYQCHPCLMVVNGCMTGSLMCEVFIGEAELETEVLLLSWIFVTLSLSPLGIFEYLEREA